MIPNRKALLPWALLVAFLAAPRASAADSYRSSLDPSIPHHAAILDTLAQIEKTPGDPALYNDLGCLVAWDGFWRDALRNFDKSAELAPKDSRPWFNGGLVLGYRGDWSGARSRFKKAVKVDPGNWPAWWMLGFSEESLGNENAAVAAYSRSLRVDTSLFDPKVNPFAVVTRLKAAALLATYERRRVDAGLPFTNQIVEAKHVASFFQKSQKSAEAVASVEEPQRTGPVVTTVPPPGPATARTAVPTLVPVTSRRRRAYNEAPERGGTEPTEVAPEAPTPTPTVPAPGPGFGEGSGAPGTGAVPPNAAAPQPTPGTAPPRRVRTPGPGGPPEPTPEE